ncbi:MAG: hypothetical protein KAS32_13985 [Candidatus Peribacteraceae bacterium]|nr:hypothetical protein [Candidatus Peribacteraceae bacterium]
MKKIIPNDCLIVEPMADVSPFTHLTWNSHGCPKTIPLHIYELNKHRLVIIEDPHFLILPDPAVEAQKAADLEKAKADADKDKDKGSEKEETKEEAEKALDLLKEGKDVTDAIKEGDLGKATTEAKDLIDKVRGHGKGKNKKR